MLEYLNFFNYFKFFAWEDFVVVFLLYNFIKFLFMSAIIELIWPTQFFNRRHTTGYTLIRFRTYTETILKLRSYSLYSYIFNLFLIKSKFIFKN